MQVIVSLFTKLSNRALAPAGTQEGRIPSELRIDRAARRGEDAVPVGPPRDDLDAWSRRARSRLQCAPPADVGSRHRGDHPGAVERQVELADRGARTLLTIGIGRDHRLHPRLIVVEIAE